MFFFSSTSTINHCVHKHKKPKQECVYQVTHYQISSWSEQCTIYSEEISIPYLAREGNN